MSNSSPIFLDVDNIFAIGAEQQSRRKSQSKEPLNYTNRAIMSFVEAVCKMNEEVLVPSKLRDIEVRECETSTVLPLNSDLYSFFQMLNTTKQDLFSSRSYQSAFMGAISNNNSGQSSGRVTPTGGQSRRSSMYGFSSNPNNVNNNNNNSTNGLNGNSGNGTPTLSTRTLMPPNTFERKLSASFSIGGEVSPDILLNNTNLLLPNSLSPLPLSFRSRTPSLSSLLAAVGIDDSPNGANGEPISSEERVQQLTNCFMHHLTALYTILGHFTHAANYITKRYQEETNEP